MYQVGLDFVRWFIGLPGARDLSGRLCREIDKSATSVVLNVAEGNGRYSELDHWRFLEIAAASAACCGVSWSGSLAQPKLASAPQTASRHAWSGGELRIGAACAQLGPACNVQLRVWL